MKKRKRDKVGEEKYTMGELSQLARRRMIQKAHKSKKVYNRKNNKGTDYDNWYPDQEF